MGGAYSHPSEGECQIIQVGVDNGASIYEIDTMLGRSPSNISREIKYSAWFPSNEDELYHLYRPRRLKAGP